MSPAAVKIRIQQIIVDYAFAPAKKANAALLDKIIDTSDTQLHYPVHGFYYRGRLYKRPGGMHGIINWPELPVGLHASMDEYIATAKELDDEELLVMPYIRAIMSSSDDPVEIMKILPSALRPPLSEAYQAAGLAFQVPPDLEELEDTLNVYPPSREAFKRRLMLNLLLD
jgi:hypothetical protein